MKAPAEERGKYVPLRNKENGLELELTFNGEVLDGEVFFPVVGQAFVERAIFVRSDVLWIPRPNRLGFVEFLVLNRDFLNLLRFLWLFLFFVVDFFDLGFLLAFLDFFLLVIFDFLENNQNSMRWLWRFSP